MIPMAAPSWRPCRCSTTGVCPGSATRGFFTCSKRSARRRPSWRWSPTTGFGNIAAAAASIPIRSRCAGRAATGSPPSPPGSVSTTEPVIGTRSPSRSTTTLLKDGWNEKRQAFTAAFGSDDLDASVLLLPDLGVIENDDPRFLSTVKAMERELLREKHVMRYAAADDFRPAGNGILDLPILAGRCMVVARPARGGT